VVHIAEFMERIKSTELLFCVVAVLEMLLVEPMLTKLIPCMNAVKGAPSDAVCRRFTKLELQTIKELLPLFIRILSLKPDCKTLDPKLVIHRFQSGTLDHALGEMLYLLPKTLSDNKASFFLAMLWVIHSTWKHQLRSVHLSAIFYPDLLRRYDPDGFYPPHIAKDRLETERIQLLSKIAKQNQQDAEDTSRYLSNL
jgi:hypothetical protein